MSSVIDNGHSRAVGVRGGCEPGQANGHYLLRNFHQEEVMHIIKELNKQSVGTI